MHSRPAPRTSKPFLKWPGSKSRALSALLPLLPHGPRLIEPFVGAGSVLLGTDYDTYVVNDANADLMATWAALQSRPREYIERAAALFISSNHSEEAYRRIRTEFNACTDRFERAVRLPYLNRFAFNGLFRVNSRDEFNVPYGRPARLPSFPVAEMEAAAEKLLRCTAITGGYASAIAMAQAGDIVYCDPPYSPTAGAASFTGYTRSRFGPADHEALVAACQEAVGRGATVLISNHDTEYTRELYRGWRIETFRVRRSIGADAQSRRAVAELVAIRP